MHQIKSFHEITQSEESVFQDCWSRTHWGATSRTLFSGDLGRSYAKRIAPKKWNYKDGTWKSMKKWHWQHWPCWRRPDGVFIPTKPFTYTVLKRNPPGCVQPQVSTIGITNPSHEKLWENTNAIQAAMKCESWCVPHGTQSFRLRLNWRKFCRLQGIYMNMFLFI